MQVELSVWHDDNFLGGVAEYCVANGIRLIAYRPLGGPQRVRRTLSDPILVEVAARHGLTPCDIALAWLTDLSPLIVAIPGPTRVETAASLARAHRVRLTDEDRACLVGAGPQDPGFARRLGFQYRDAADFFAAANKQEGRP